MKSKDLLCAIAAAADAVEHMRKRADETEDAWQAVSMRQSADCYELALSWMVERLDSSGTDATALKGQEAARQFRKRKGEAEAAGFLAFHAGKSTDDCPYSDNGDGCRAGAWCHGWFKAERAKVSR
jgi:ribosome modulation factor